MKSRKRGNGEQISWLVAASVKLIIQINEKITSLCSYYGTEKRKEKGSKASGAETSDVYVSSWRFINY